MVTTPDTNDSTPFTKGDDAWAIEFPKYDRRKIDMKSDGYPCTRNGFVASTDGKIIPDFTVPRLQEILDGAIAYRVSDSTTPPWTAKWEWYDGGWNIIR